MNTASPLPSTTVGATTSTARSPPPGSSSTIQTGVRRLWLRPPKLAPTGLLNSTKKDWSASPTLSVRTKTSATAVYSPGPKVTVPLVWS